METRTEPKNKHHEKRLPPNLTSVQLFQLDAVGEGGAGGNAESVASSVSEGVLGLEGDDGLLLEVHVLDGAFETLEDVVILALTHDERQRARVEDDAVGRQLAFDRHRHRVAVLRLFRPAALGRNALHDALVVGVGQIGAFPMEELHFENKSRLGRDRGWRSVGAVSVRRSAFKEGHLGRGGRGRAASGVWGRKGGRREGRRTWEGE